MALVLVHQALIGEGGVGRLEIALALMTSAACFLAFVKATGHRSPAAIEFDPASYSPLPPEALDVTAGGTAGSSPLMAALARARQDTASTDTDAPDQGHAIVPTDPIRAQADVHFHAAVLLASSNVTARQRLSSMLSTLGCEVETADCEREVVRAFAGRRFDLVLLDCDSADVGGFAAARAIRDDEARCFAHPPVPLVGMTRDVVSVDPERRVLVGMSELVARPVEHHQVADILHRWLPARLRTPNGAPPPQESEAQATPSDAHGLRRASSW